MEPHPTTPDDTGMVDAAADATDPVAPEQDDPTAPHHEAHLPPGMTRGPATVRSFRMVLLNTLVANVTTSYLWFALTFWAYLETRSVMATAIIGGAFMLFIAISGMYFGTLVDRHRKKPIMVVSSIVTFGAFVLAGIVAWLFPDSALIDWTGPIFWVFVLIILAGAVIESLRNIALSTTVTLLIPADDRDKANGLVGTVQGVAFMVTSVFSGLSIGFLGMHWTLVVAIVLTGLSLVHLLTIPIPEREPEIAEDEKRPIFDFAGAMAVIRQVPGLLALIFFACFNNLVGGVYMALMDPYGLELFSVQSWGVVLGVTSIGFIVGGALVAKFGLGAKPLKTLLMVNVLVAVVGGFFTIRELWWVYAVGIFVYMCFIPVAEAAEQTILQRVVPFRSQGRVFGFAQSIEAGAAPISAFLIGPIAQYWLIPYMATDAGKDRFGWLLGEGSARGIALVFLLASIVMLVVVLLAFASRPYRQLTKAYEDAAPVS
ncbi:MAG TPA: MFS transporter [Phycicoccus sp.]|jgi:DHA3 family multidrug efflux protein-like MFS transporter|nr:MFS transporter [Phycicoccus sp.]HQH07479.1 MFS transporter [Phycicoccus sp.]HQK30207.1 MFS transporter [Phycicoccus sp.]